MGFLKMTDKRRILAFSLAAIALLHISAKLIKAPKHPKLETVAFVDVEKYMGTWYEIASFPTRFQKDCYCSMAQYTLNKEKGYVEVINSCRKKSPQGEKEQVKGKAFITDATTNAKLKVQFFWPFKGKYWIIALAKDYSYAMVGHPNREYLWILNRMPQMEETEYKKLVAIAQEKGFDINLLQRADQGCFISGKK